MTIKILVVDLYPVRSLLAELLAERGNGVKNVGTSWLARQEIAFWRPHLLITNYELTPGGFEGLNLIRFLRQDSRAPAILMLKGEDDFSVAIKSGIADYLLFKPFRADEMWGIVDSAISRAEWEKVF